MHAGQRAQVKCVLNLHPSLPLTPSLRRIDRKRLVRYGKEAAELPK
jgi:hypothetical protein